MNVYPEWLPQNVVVHLLWSLADDIEWQTSHSGSARSLARLSLSSRTQAEIATWWRFFYPCLLIFVLIATKRSFSLFICSMLLLVAHSCQKSSICICHAVWTQKLRSRSWMLGALRLAEKQTVGFIAFDSSQLKCLFWNFSVVFPSRQLVSRRSFWCFVYVCTMSEMNLRRYEVYESIISWSNVNNSTQLCITTQKHQFLIFYWAKWLCRMKVK